MILSVAIGSEGLNSTCLVLMIKPAEAPSSLGRSSKLLHHDVRAIFRHPPQKVTDYDGLARRFVRRVCACFWAEGVAPPRAFGSHRKIAALRGY